MVMALEKMKAYMPKEGSRSSHYHAEITLHLTPFARQSPNSATAQTVTGWLCGNELGSI
jgi:hypothetical protein